MIDDSNSITSPALSFVTDTDTGMFRKSANVIGFSTAGVERFSIDSAGITLANRGDIRFSESSSNGTNYVGLQAPSAVSSNVVFTFTS